MRAIIGLAVVLALGTLLVTGCDTSSTPPADVGGVATVLCGGCGQVKGSDVCCAKDAEKCPKCGLAKGSPGCCKIEKGTDAKLCTKCGQIAGSDVCCAKDAEKCGKCGLAKGSPGCCKIKT